LDLRTAAKYPFLKEAAKVLKDRGITLEDLVKKMAYEPARLQGYDRVLETLDNLTIDNHAMAKEADAVNELLSYPVARMIVSATGDQRFINRYAIAEAKTASRRLELEDAQFILKVGQELGVVAQPFLDGFGVDFADFLRFSTRMKSKDWKLVNQRVLDGQVVVSKGRLVRLIEQSITDKIASELPLPVNDDILLAFSKQLAEITGTLEEEKKKGTASDLGRISIYRFPPCMKKLLDMIRAGENVPHTGRFALVAFLHTLGMDSEEILKTFSTSPDFSEDKSRYQIQHISGEISGTEYTPPECSTMKSYGICFDPDKLCSYDWMTHPLKYYRAKGKRRKLGQ